MFQTLCVRVPVVGGIVLAALAGNVLPALAGDRIPPRPQQCYTLSTNPPAGPYDPEVTVCQPDRG